MALCIVYKRRKRKHDAPTLPPPPAFSTLTTTNYEQYLRRVAYKKAALLSLKAKYAQEIREWESLSQMSQSTPPSDITTIKDPVPPSSSLPRTQMQNARKCILEDLLQQAEAQETFIQDVTTICNAAELMCEAHERDLILPALDLPVLWSPATLVHSLCPSDSDDNS